MYETSSERLVLCREPSLGYTKQVLSEQPYAGIEYEAPPFLEARGRPYGPENWRHNTAKVLENPTSCFSGPQQANTCKMTVNTQSTLSQHYSQHYSQHCQNAGKSSIFLSWTLRS